MIRILATSMLALAAVLAPPANACQPTLIEVFTSGALSARVSNQVKILRKQGYQVKHFDLAARDRIAGELKLPGREAAARQLVEQKINTDPDWTSRLAAAWIGPVRAHELGLKKIPAVAVDGSIYATERPALALKTWKAQCRQ